MLRLHFHAFFFPLRKRFRAALKLRNGRSDSERSNAKYDSLRYLLAAPSNVVAISSGVDTIRTASFRFLHKHSGGLAQVSLFVVLRLPSDRCAFFADHSVSKLSPSKRDVFATSR